MARGLIEKGKADVEAVDKGRMTPLLSAVAEGQVAVMEALIDEYNADIAAVDTYSRTPLHIACKNGQMATVQALVEKFGVVGLDFNSVVASTTNLITPITPFAPVAPRFPRHSLCKPNPRHQPQPRT